MNSEIYLYLLPDRDNLDNYTDLAAVVSTNLHPNFQIVHSLVFPHHLSASKFKLILISVSQFRTSILHTTDKERINFLRHIAIAKKKNPELFFSPYTTHPIHNREPLLSVWHEALQHILSLNRILKPVQTYSTIRKAERFLNLHRSTAMTQ